MYMLLFLKVFMIFRFVCRCMCINNGDKSGERSHQNIYPEAEVYSKPFQISKIGQKVPS